MTATRRCLVISGVVLAVLGPARAQADEKPVPRAHGASAAEDEERTLVFGVGGAGEYSFRDRALHPGAHVFVEWAAIHDWLELELGASLLSSSGGLEAPFDLLIKKPFQLARHVELMLGIGPEIVRAPGTTTQKGGTFVGLELGLDFMFWPWRHVGAWLEPGYDIVFHHGASHGLGLTGGLLAGW